ncbi:hypothetical protein FHS18_001884 [Paenibacillus phyllosphaerae]|uniref:Uncharacterized protein n=1 Tax=Paenibacillus phyllosphaerae TaxID=274593 RepID=A0A7W5AXA2_9BACL|nr:hypothetical protein [Paenibacillus phyllosphaerae]MBB3109821.1 hypothetical protein [Paenibacillus phyllosphaerae]
MPIAIAAVWLIVMIMLDLWDGLREGPRPTRVKAVYVILLTMILYQAVITFGRLHWPGFYELAYAIFGPIGGAIVRALGGKG